MNQGGYFLLVRPLYLEVGCSTLRLASIITFKSIRWETRATRRFILSGQDSFEEHCIN